MINFPFIFFIALKFIRFDIGVVRFCFFLYFACFF